MSPQTLPALVWRFFTTSLTRNDWYFLFLLFSLVLFCFFFVFHRQCNLNSTHGTCTRLDCRTSRQHFFAYTSCFARDRALLLMLCHLGRCCGMFWGRPQRSHGPVPVMEENTVHDLHPVLRAGKFTLLVGFVSFSWLLFGCEAIRRTEARRVAEK